MKCKTHSHNRILRFSAFIVAGLLFVMSINPKVIYGAGLSSASSGSSQSGSSTSSSSTKELKNQLASLQKEYDKLETELSDNKKKISSITDQQKKIAAEQNSLSRAIEISEQQIRILEERIVIINDQIAQKEQEITDKQGDIDANYELFKTRMRALYMTDTSSVMNVLFGSQSFSEFLERSEYISRVTEHDDVLIKRLREDKVAIETAKAEIEEAKAELDAAKTSESAKKKDLDNQYSKLSAEQALLKKTEAAYKADQARIQKEMKEADAEIDAIVAKIQSIGEYVGGDLGWPLPGYTSLSSYYGWRFNGSDFHTGIDITGSGVYGASIVAANAGRVAFVQTSYTPGKGYGMYVIIDHGGNMVTLYGHMSSISVSLGDRVSKGQTIGKVGSTGWSTGPHLHFEVRVGADGKHTNPLNYL